MTTYFTSDTHFGHQNIIDYCKRPFANVEEMTEGLVANWNAVVKPADTVFHLGDFAMGPKVHHKSFFERLNGKKLLIRGNHDQSHQKMLDMGWDSSTMTYYTSIEGKNVWMTHIPPKIVDPYEGRTYPPEFGAYLDQPENHPLFDIHLCGHVHNAWKRRGDVINVGVDVWGYRPVTFQELLSAFDENLHR